MDTGEIEPQSKRQASSAKDTAEDAETLDLEIGPFFNTATLSAWLGAPRRAIYRQKRQRIILAVTTADRRFLYPAFQWSEAKEPLPALPEVLAILDPADEDPVGSAVWLNAHAKRFDGATPSELLRRGDKEAVLVVARRIAAAGQA